MMKLLIITFGMALLSSSLLHAQPSSTQESVLSPWSVHSINEYVGEYQFGDSESESSLYLVNIEGAWVGQIREGNWSESGLSWVKKYRNLKDIEIDIMGNFRSKEYAGNFFRHSDNKDSEYSGLKIVNPWTVEYWTRNHELGKRVLKSLPEMFHGNFPEASYMKLPEIELKRAPKKKLEMMVNEIKARYGYIFSKDKAMDKHFQKQQWYRGEHKSVDKFFTWIEEENIRRIEQVSDSKLRVR